MKHGNRFWIYPLVVMGFLLMLTSSCEKDENLPDYASEIAGTYDGTVTLVGTGTVSASSTFTRSSNTKVDLIVTIGSNNISLDGIDITSSGGNIYNLSYSDSSGSFQGKVEGNVLTWTLTAGSIVETFSGTKL